MKAKQKIIRPYKFFLCTNWSSTGTHVCVETAGMNLVVILLV